MTEPEFYRLLAHPLIFAISFLSFSKAPRPKRILGASAGAAAGIGIGLIALWANRAGAPGWTGWAVLAAVLALTATWAWRKRDRTSTSA